jgi:hypothetical protein
VKTMFFLFHYPEQDPETNLQTKVGKLEPAAGKLRQLAPSDRVLRELLDEVRGCKPTPKPAARIAAKGATR